MIIKIIFINRFIFENPAASKEVVDAGVFRMVYENKVRSIRPKSVRRIRCKIIRLTHDLGRRNKKLKVYT